MLEQGGSGNTPPTTPAQGSNGGTGSNTGQALGGSGGGATGSGGSTSPGWGTDRTTGGAGQLQIFQQVQLLIQLEEIISRWKWRHW